MPRAAGNEAPQRILLYVTPFELGDYRTAARLKFEQAFLAGGDVEPRLPAQGETTDGVGMIRQVEGPDRVTGRRQQGAAGE